MSDEGTAAHGPDRRRRTQLIVETLAIIRSISPQDKEKLALQPLLKLGGQEAQDMVDILQTIADSPQLSERERFLTLKTIFRLSRASQRYPQCYVIENLVRGKRIGRGGFGDVYTGEIATCYPENQAGYGPNRIEYVVKTVPLSIGGKPYVRIEECIREAVLWRQFRHPNVLPFLGMYYQDDNREDVCFVSPYMNNGNLADMLGSGCKPSQEDMYTLVHDITSGLKYLHGENVIHGDLKPDNVLITDHFRACLCDFGQSRLASTMGISTTHKLGGTPGYIAPEVIRGGPTSGKSDVYSFGCLCNEVGILEVDRSY